MRHVVRLQVQLGQNAALAELAEVDVGQGREDVAVLGIGEVVEELQQHHHMDPPVDFGEQARGFR